MFDIENDIRIADTGDFQELFRICCLLHAENGAHPFSEVRSSAFIWKGCNKDNAIIGVIGPSDNIKAVIYLEVQSIYYSDDYQLGEAFNYVRVDCRKSDYAKQMINFAKKCADETGLDLTIGIISDARLDVKQRLYDRYLPRGGVFYIYNQRRDEIYKKIVEERIKNKIPRGEAVSTLAEKLYNAIPRSVEDPKWRELGGRRRESYCRTIRALVDDRNLIDAVSKP